MAWMHLSDPGQEAYEGARPETQALFMTPSPTWVLPEWSRTVDQRNYANTGPDLPTSIAGPHSPTHPA